MKALITLCLLLVGAYCASISDPDWEDFKSRYGKKYKSGAEESHRQTVFHDNLNTIKQHNQQVGKTYTMGINEFCDLTNTEFNAQMNGLKMPVNVATSNRARRTSRALPNSLPSTVDWRPLGYVTPVKDQGPCGSCWAFSATGSLEGQHFAKTGTLTSLSEENLVDCSGAYGNWGCDGGLMDYAFQYIQANNGIDTETSYPYQAVNGACAFNATNVGATDTGFVDIASQSEPALQNAIATIGPISVAIDASQNSFQLYESGVYNEPACSSTSLDHGVLAVGYNLTGGYYIVKNSWGTSWGMAGYIWMTLGNNNQCGIATMASYPTV